MKSSCFFPIAVCRTLTEIVREHPQPLALAIGVFDGVHLGHRRLLHTVQVMAKEAGALPVALTFDPHPRAVLQPSAPPILLLSLAERYRKLKACGMAEVAAVHFTPDFAKLAPEDFLDMLLCEVPQLAAVGVGEHWRFGNRGSGGAELLARYAERHCWKLAAVPEVELDGEVVSSSRIRLALSGGDFALAERLLGEPYVWSGSVASGYGIAGSNLDCPTANVELDAGVLPPDGVYAGIVEVAEKRYPAAFNIGISPTYTYARGAETRRRIEAHLLDFQGSLYGCNVRFRLVHYLRSERCFGSEAELKTQIRHDVSAIRQLAAEWRLTE